MRDLPYLPIHEVALNLAELETKTKDELVDVAKDLGVEKPTGLRKQDLVFRIMQAKAEREGNYFAGGILEMASDGYGFLRTQSLKPSLSDVYVSQTQVRRFALRGGDYVMGAVRQPKDSEKYYGLLRVDAVNGLDPETAKKRPYFEQLTPIFPDERIELEEGLNNLSTRVIDLVAPVGRGQRGLIVSPPKAGKTLLLKTIATATANHYEDIYILVVLIGERPEEVTDWRRSVQDAEVVAATFDDPVEEQTRVAEMAIERAKRLVESGRHVMVLLDGITRLTRAYNLALPPVWPHAVRWYRPGGPAPAEAPVRHGAQRGGGRIADDHRDLPRGHGQPHGRGDLRRVQGHRQLGAVAGPPPLREAHLPGDRHRQERHAPRRPAAGRADVPACGAAAPDDGAGGAELLEPDGADGADPGSPVADAEQRRVPGDAQRRWLAPVCR